MSFILFAQAHGVLINESRFITDGRIHRCGTVQKPRSLNGAYMFDGSRGWCFNWSEGARTEWYNDPNAKPWTPAEQKEFVEKRRRDSDEREASYLAAAKRSATILNNSELKEHPYLHIKGLGQDKGLVIGDSLLVPMRSYLDGNLQGHQSITWDGDARKYDKKMLAGMKAKGAVCLLGPREATERFFVEGYATGLSLVHGLRSIGLKATVVVCFSANNLVYVADKYSGPRFVFADNDASGTGQAAAEQTGLPWTMSPVVGEDANDVHKNNGLMSLCKLIVDLRRKSMNA